MTADFSDPILAADFSNYLPLLVIVLNNGTNNTIIKHNITNGYGFSSVYQLNFGGGLLSDITFISDTYFVVGTKGDKLKVFDLVDDTISTAIIGLDASVGGGSVNTRILSIFGGSHIIILDS